MLALILSSQRSSVEGRRGRKAGGREGLERKRSAEPGSVCWLYIPDPSLGTQVDMTKASTSCNTHTSTHRLLEVWDFLGPDGSLGQWQLSSILCAPLDWMLEDSYRGVQGQGRFQT